MRLETSRFTLSGNSPAFAQETDMKKDAFIGAAKVIGIWIPALLLVAIFAPQGWSKFSDTSGWAAVTRPESMWSFLT